MSRRVEFDHYAGFNPPKLGAVTPEAFHAAFERARKQSKRYWPRYTGEKRKDKTWSPRALSFLQSLGFTAVGRLFLDGYDVPSAEFLREAFLDELRNWARARKPTHKPTPSLNVAESVAAHAAKVVSGEFKKSVWVDKFQEGQRFGRNRGRDGGSNSKRPTTWTETEIDLLFSWHVTGVPVEQQARLLKRSPGRVSMKRRDLGIARTYARRS